MYVSLSSLVLWLSVSLLLSTTRSNNTMLRSMRVLDRWSRLSMLLETEIAEGMRITYDSTVSPACGGGVADVVATVTIPYYLPSLNQLATTSISYFARNGDLFRCGPVYQANGQLRPDQPAVVSLLSPRTRFAVDQSETTSQDPARSMRYSLQFLDAGNASLLSRSATARTRVSLIQ